MPQGGNTGGRPTPSPPQPGKKKQKPGSIPAAYVWWPLNDGPATTDAGGTHDLQYRQGAPLSRYNVAAANYGALTSPSAGWFYDPRMGGYVYNNNKGQHAQSAHDPAITFVSFGFEFKTFSVWARASAAPSAAFGAVVEKRFSDGDIFGIRLDQATMNWQLLYGSGGTAHTIASLAPANLNRWYHLSATIDGSNVVNFFVDAVSQGTFTGAPAGNGEIWSVGDRSANDRPFAGFIYSPMGFVPTFGGSQLRALAMNPNPFAPPDPSPPVPGGGGGPPPPVPDPGTTGPIIFGTSATPVKPRDLVVGTRGVQKPLLQ